MRPGKPAYPASNSSFCQLRQKRELRGQVSGFGDPRKIIDDAAYLATAPELLRALVRGPAALLAAMGVFDEPERELSDVMLDWLRRAVGGEAALDALHAKPLPDEPFAWDAVAADVHDRVGEVLELVDRCCAEVLDHEYRTVCRRLLASAAGQPKMLVKDLTRHFGTAGTGASQRSETAGWTWARRATSPGSAARASSPTGTATARRRPDMDAPTDPALGPLARDCPAALACPGSGRALAGFVGEGRALTASGSPRRARACSSWVSIVPWQPHLPAIQ